MDAIVNKIGGEFNFVQIWTTFSKFMKCLDENPFEEESHQALSVREEADLERLMEQSGFTIHNARAFTEQLSKEVAAMDSLNIQSLMASEQRVENLIKNLENAITEASEMELKIENYQNYLKNVGEIVFQIQQKESLVQIQNENNLKLLNELESLINSINFTQDYENYLRNGDISTEKGIRLCLKAANTLSDCLNANIHPALHYLNAVQEQRSKLEVIQSKFAKRVFVHINNVYNFATKEYGDNLLNDINAQDLMLPSHDVIHNILLPYSGLLKWTKYNCKDVFNNLMNSYVNSVKQIYEKEILNYFEIVRERLSGSRSTSSESTEVRRKSFTVTSEISKLSTSNLSSQFQDIGDSTSRSSEMSLSEWEEFDSCVDRMLSAIDPYCFMEQKFCIEFFDIDTSANQFVKDHKRNSSWSSQTASVSPSPSNPSQSSNDTNDPRKSETLKKVLADIFSILESEFLKFISYYDKLDGLYSEYLLVRLIQHLLTNEDTGSYLAKTYGTILIQVKRNFDKFMSAQKIAIEESKVPKKAKCGIFPFVKNFEQFAKQAESVFKNASARRADIDRWYITLVRTIVETINHLSREHHKTPAEIIKLENYHYLHNLLCTLKIACLENEKKEFKQRYNEALNDYVARYFGRPLEKLNTFFEGVQQKVSQGVKEEEVGYQLAYSKQELRKVIKDCSLKEVRRGLEEMYRKVEKHAADPDSTLIQVSKCKTRLLVSVVNKIVSNSKSYINEMAISGFCLI